MKPEAYASIQALNRCTFLPASYVKRFVRDMAAKGPDDTLTEKQEAFLKKVTWNYRKQIYALDPDFDMTWTLDHPKVIEAILRKQKR